MDRSEEMKKKEKKTINIHSFQTQILHFQTNSQREFKFNVALASAIHNKSEIIIIIINADTFRVPKLTPKVYTCNDKAT